MMRIICGLEDASSYIANRGGIDSIEVPESIKEGIRRIFGSNKSPIDVVAQILEEVKLRGDSAVREFSLRIDGIEQRNVEISAKEMKVAYESLTEGLKDAIKLSSKRISDFTKMSLPKSWYDETLGLGETVVPLERVGIYVPGGTAAYPSTVLMTAVTAKAAGVSEIVMCSPLSNGVESQVTLAAAYVAGVDRLFNIGGAQAIAAMAYGTESIPSVHKICGPGNIFVSLAKKLLFGFVGIDGIFGPTETMVMADENADPRICAADLLAQAEHDILASPVLVTNSEKLADQVKEELLTQLASLERRDIASAAISGQGIVFIVDDLDEATQVANLFAPEHLTLMVNDPWRIKPQIRHAGAVFLGDGSGEVFGDYIAGPSHTIPTHGTARFSSYLGSDQFVKRFPVMFLNESVVSSLIDPTAMLARSEGLTAHARAVEYRKETRNTSRGGK